MNTVARETMDYDVVIVGAGPAGLSAAIRLKQIDPEIAVVVLEKGSEVGAHILSGAVIDPIGLDTLLPDWRTRQAPVHTPVKQDRFYLLGSEGHVRLPNIMMPPLMRNHGNYIVSLGNVCRWLAQQAEDLGVEILPGFAASEPVFGDDGALCGVVAGEMGLTKDRKPGPSYEPGVQVCGKYVLIAEGVRGSLAKLLIARYALDAHSDVPKFGIGLKELWEVDPQNHRPGQITHTMGWPLKAGAGGGSFMYHLENNQVAIGFVVHLNYKNPYLSPYNEFQRFKHHPLIKPVLEGGRRISYGARAISEGGWQSLPKMAFPGGLLLGCAAGLVNVPRIKGSHNAILSGCLAADAVAQALEEGRCGDTLKAFSRAFDASPIRKDLWLVRNVKPLWAKCGLAGGVILGGLDMWINQIFGTSAITLRHTTSDAKATEPASMHKPVVYPRPDGVISFDRLTNVSYSFTSHEESQPAHLRLEDPDKPIRYTARLYEEPAQRYCPAGVYEVLPASGEEPERFAINFQNCVHCKTCDIKDPPQNITWTTPQGGDGPNYPNM